MALGNKTGLKTKKKEKEKKKRKGKKRKKLEKVESYIDGFHLPFLFLWQHLKVERIRLYLPSIKYDNEAIEIFRDKCPLSILPSLGQGYF